jgi:DnaJ family protein C protein 19
LFTSIAGKSFIKFYRAVKLKNAFTGQALIGKHYKGGFEHPMSRREAALILNVRYVF